jgi:hypothetical protein
MKRIFNLDEYKSDPFRNYGCCEFIGTGIGYYPYNDIRLRGGTINISEKQEKEIEEKLQGSSDDVSSILRKYEKTLKNLENDDNYDEIEKIKDIESLNEDIQELKDIIIEKHFFERMNKEDKEDKNDDEESKIMNNELDEIVDPDIMYKVNKHMIKGLVDKYTDEEFIKNSKLKNTFKQFKNVLNNDKAINSNDTIVTSYLKKQMDKERERRIDLNYKESDLGDGKVFEGVMETNSERIFKTSEGLKNREVDLGEYATFDFSNDLEDADAKYYKNFDFENYKEQYKILKEAIKKMKESNFPNKKKEEFYKFLNSKISLIVPYLQTSKYTGWSKYIPYYTIVNGERKLYNIGETEYDIINNMDKFKRYVNDKFNKDVNIYYKFKDGVYEYNLNKDDDIKFTKIKKKGINGEDLYIIKSNQSKLTKIKDHSNNDAYVLDFDKLKKISYFK